MEGTREEIKLIEEEMGKQNRIKERFLVQNLRSRHSENVDPIDMIIMYFLCAIYH